MAAGGAKRQDGSTEARKRLESPRLLNRILWISALVLVAGVVAALIAFVGNTGKKTVAPPAPSKAQLVTKKQKQVPLDKEVQRVAGKFILTAVARKDLATAWKLSGPGIRQGQSYKEWLTGNIAVVPYPDFASVHFAVAESYPTSATLEVVLAPKKGSRVQSQTFFIKLNAVGTSKQKHWVVNYWAPQSPTVTHVPINGTNGID